MAPRPHQYHQSSESESVKRLTAQSRFLTTLKKKPSEKHCGKKEKNAGNQHFLIFPQCFLPFSKQISIFYAHLFCRLQMLTIGTSLKKSSFGKKL